VSLEPDALLSDATLDNAVAALLDRNAHHFAEMDDAQRQEAISTWRDIARAVLTAAAAAVGQEVEPRDPQDGGGRAIIVLEDTGPDQVAIHASFFPPPEQHDDEMLVTPAQATALEMLDGMADHLEPEQ
jgi:hypothetical protein